MQRRRILLGVSAGMTTLLAGCGGDGGGDEATPTRTPAQSTTQAPTQTPAQSTTQTPGQSSTQTPTRTPTQTPPPDGSSGITHEIGEEFTVGGDGNEITYRILELARADRIGDQVNFNEADGTFLIVTLELTNPRNETIEFPRLDFRLKTEDAWQRFDREPSQKVGSDDRLDVEHLGDASISAGASRIGSVVFDVDPDLSYRIWITPTGDATTPEHFVPVGDISSVEALGGY